MSEAVADTKAAPIATAAVPDPNLPATKPDVASPPVDDKSAAQFNALVRKEKGIFKRQQELEAREKVIAEREAKAKADLERWESIHGSAKTNPLKALKDLGLEYKDVTDFILNQEKPTVEAEIKAIRDEIINFRKQTEEEKKAAAEEAKKEAEKRNQEVVQEYQNQIASFVEQNADEFDLVHLFGAHAMIFSGIQTAYNETGKVPTIKEAAKGVQDYLSSKMDDLIPKTKWYQAKHPKKEEPKTPDGSKPTTTLSNSMQPGMGTQLPAQTEQERIKRALAALETA